MKRTDPYLNFAGNARKAFEFYRSVFGGDFLGVLRFRDFEGNPMGMAEEHLDDIAHIALPLGDSVLMGTDVAGVPGEQLRQGNNFSIHVEADTEAEARQIFDGLAAGGTIDMPLARTDWAQLFGSLADRFGVQWMVSYTGDVDFSYPR
jgi:PhnB protein